METKDARESCRRKLLFLSRGSHRLAFTGQSRSLSEPDSPSSPPLSAGSSVFAKLIEPPEIGTASIEGLTDEPTVVSPTSNEVFTASVSSSRAAQIIDETSSEIKNNSNIAQIIFTLKEFSNSISTLENNIRMNRTSNSISTLEKINMVGSVITALLTVICFTIVFYSQ